MSFFWWRDASFFFREHTQFVRAFAMDIIRQNTQEIVNYQLLVCRCWYQTPKTVLTNRRPHLPHEQTTATVLCVSHLAMGCRSKCKCGMCSSTHRATPTISVAAVYPFNSQIIAMHIDGNYNRKTK